MRGCTYDREDVVRAYKVSPAHAGMYPSNITDMLVASRFPRTCGDVPMAVALLFLSLVFPPHMRGCTGRG